jgi:GLPGLI family protein
MKMTYLKSSFLLMLLLFSLVCQAQYREGKITYERRTNLHKTMGPRAKQWIEEKDKIKKDIFELTFTDTASYWALKPTDIAENSQWGMTTSKNKVYRNLKTTRFYTIRDIWGQEVHIEDELPNRQWKMTDGKRTIAGFECRKAFWQVDDSTKIYAWYCDEIIPSIGPERFHDLPGAILGLASEDGGTVYFATKVDFYQPKQEELEIKRAKKVQSLQETRDQIETTMGKNSWMKMNLDHYFIW